MADISELIIISNYVFINSETPHSVGDCTEGVNF